MIHVGRYENGDQMGEEKKKKKKNKKIKKKSEKKLLVLCGVEKVFLVAYSQLIPLLCAYVCVFHAHAVCCARPVSLLPLLLPRLVVLCVRPLAARLGISPLGIALSVPFPHISCSSSRAGKLSPGWLSSSCKQQSFSIIR